MINGDVHQFVVHCLIPLDPWIITLVAKVFFISFSLFVGLTTLKTFIDFWLFDSSSWVSKRFNQLLIVIYRRGNFVHHHWWCTSIYRPLSYLFRSLVELTITIIEFTIIISKISFKYIYWCIALNLFSSDKVKGSKFK